MESTRLVERERLTNRRPSERGSVLIYSLFSLIVLSLIASLAVDYGRLTLVKTELQTVADSAARAAATRLSGARSGDGPAAASAAAQWLAGMNQADGYSMALDASRDIEMGNWDETASPRFLVGRTPTNAVRVTARRTRDRNTSVPMTMASSLGFVSADVSATATARTYAHGQYGIIGIDRIRFSSLGVLARVRGNLYSNGDIDVGWPLGLLVGVQGDARSYGGQVRHGALAGISGNTAPLSQRLEFPPVTMPPSNDNDKIASLLDSNGDLSSLLGVRIPPGRYVVRDLTLLAGIDIQIDGPVEFFVKRNFNVAAGVNLFGSTSPKASDFKVRVAKGGNVFFLANLLVPVYMDIYAPEVDVDINVAVNRYTGALIAKTLDVNVPLLSEIVQDTTLTDAGPSVSGLSLVQ